MSTAHERRLTAIREVMTTFLDSNGDWNHAWSRQEIADAIRGRLVDLGRTGRWYNAVTTWESMVLDTEHDPHWAFLQGSIMVLHAA